MKGNKINAMRRYGTDEGIGKLVGMPHGADNECDFLNKARVTPRTQTKQEKI